MELSKLRQVRAGNKSAITRLLTKLEDFTSSKNLTAVRTDLRSLSDKREVIQQLNEKIILQIKEKDIEDEIVDTDEYLFDLECKLSEIKAFIGEHEVSFSHPHQTTQSVLNVHAQNLTPHAQNCTPRVDRVNANQSDSSFNPVGHQLSSSSSVASQFHKLPKLNLPTFTGDILQWRTFWDSFQSTIHFNASLTEIQKFNYLKAQLQGQASQCIEGLPLTSNNYMQAIDILIQRFGQPHEVTNAYMENLINIPAPRSNASSLRSFYDKVESYIRGLDSLGQCESSFGSLLVPIIKNKLPPNVRQNIMRDHGGDNWDLQSLREAIRKEVCILDSGQTEPEVVPTASFVTGTFDSKPSKDKGQTLHSTNAENRKSCLFCQASHSPNECTNVTDYKARVDIVKAKNVCFNCFGSHKVDDCRSKFKCRKCEKKHHTSICRGQQRPQPSSIKFTNSVRSNEKEEKLGKTSTTALHSTSINTHSNVLLKTAVAPVWSDDKNTMANILLDEGAQNSFITEDLAEKLEIECVETISIKIAAFGGNNKHVRHLKTASISVEAYNGDRIPMEVVIIPKIATPIENRARSKVVQFPYLKNLPLAHPVSNNDKFNISLLIGADYYWNIVQDQVIRGDGPTAVKSVIGYLLLGPIDTSNASTTLTSTMGFMNTSIMNILINHSAEDVDLERFWKLESLGVSEDEQTQKYGATSIAFNDGKYKAKLLWKQESVFLPTNYKIVKRRTESVVRWLEREPHLLTHYSNIMEEQEQRGFIEKVQDTKNDGKKIHYIPHHPVHKDSSTTPIRIVFDCSCKEKTGTSLNECLESHAPIMNDLTAIHMRFRLQRYAVSSDIEKAFLQIELDEDDRDVTRFLWLSDPTDPNSPPPPTASRQYYSEQLVRLSS